MWTIFKFVAITCVLLQLSVYQNSFLAQSPGQHSPRPSWLGSGKPAVSILPHRRLWRVNLGGHGTSVVSPPQKFLAMKMSVTLKLFSSGFVPLLSPNPDDATAANSP